MGRLIWRAITGDLNDLEKANLGFLLVFGGGFILAFVLVAVAAVGIGYLMWKIT